MGKINFSFKNGLLILLFFLIFIGVNAQIDECESVFISESFEGDFPPTCWTNTGSVEYGLWESASAETGNLFPITNPQDGAKMIRIWRSDAFESKGILTSPALVTNGRNQAISFWMYRNLNLNASGSPVQKDDKVEVYISKTGDIDGLTPILTIHRNVDLSPIVGITEEANGWYNYTAILPCAEMEKVYVSLVGVIGSMTNSDLILDNVSIGECMPVNELKALLFASDVGVYNQVDIEWTAPLVDFLPKGYNLYRNGILIADNLTETTFRDQELEKGEYVYCVEALYDNDCALSEQACVSISVTQICPGSTLFDLEAIPYADDWFDVDLSWVNAGSEKLDYGNNQPNMAIYRPETESISLAIRFAPEDLAKYNGLSLTGIDFVPSHKDIDYTIKIWRGTEGSMEAPKPKTLVGNMIISADEMNILDAGTEGFAWNQVYFDTPIVIDVSQEMWIEVQVDDFYDFVAGMTMKSPAKYRYSDLVSFDGGDWNSLADYGNPIDWCLKGIVGSAENELVIRGYHVYRDNELLTSSALATTGYYRDHVPGTGTYLYEVSTVYEDDLCETAQRTQIEVEILPYACDEQWSAFPILEDFEGQRFPSWCWNIDSDSDLAWDQVSQGLYPSCKPHSGEGMIRFYGAGFYLPGAKSTLTTPMFITEKEYVLSFWMQRDDYEYSSAADHVNVYLSETLNIDGLTPIITVHSLSKFEPIVETGGWYHYEVPLSTEGMDGAYVILEAVRDNEMYGSRDIYIDDIAIYNPCGPVINLNAFSTTHSVNLSWEYPVGEATEFEIIRDDTVLTTVNELTFIDSDVAGGGMEYEYCIRPVYDSCQGEATCIIISTAECDPIPVTDLTLITNDDDDLEVSLSWNCEEADVLFEIYRNGVLLNTTYSLTYTDNENLTYDLTYEYCVKPVSDVCIGGEEVCDKILIESPEGLDSVQNYDIVLSPNPALTQVNIMGENMKEITIFDISGRQLEHFLYSEGKQELTINVSGYKPGIYLVKITNINNEFVVKQLIITK